MLQGNPDKYDIDSALLNYNPIFWIMGKPASARDVEHAELGDRVFMWRSAGKQHVDSGVVAVGTLIGLPITKNRRDIRGSHLWTKPPVDPVSFVAEIEIADKRLSKAAGMLLSEDLKVDSVLSRLWVIRFAQGTTYTIEPEEESRLIDLWHSKSAQPRR